MTNAWLDEIHVIPLDQIEIPKTDEVRPLQDLVQEALKNRAEIETANVNLDSKKILLKGTRNNLLPVLQAYAELTNNGLAGPANPLYQNCCGVPSPYFWAAPVPCWDRFWAVTSRIIRPASPQYSIPQPPCTGRLRHRRIATAPVRIVMQRATNQCAWM